MALNKNDLNAITKIVDSSVETTKKELRKEIFNVEDKLSAKIEASENKIISILSKEITDLSDINRAVITRTDELDARLRIVERKLGLISS